jgi:glutamine amidotransferase
LIALIDYGMGNLGSVEKALQAAGCVVSITADPRVLEAADGLVLPGVGAFDDCMAGLTEHGLVEPLRELIAADKPFLGICLGLQMLFECSEEGSRPGLGVFAGRVERFRHELKIPQIGWNQIQVRQATPQLAGVPEGSWFYFVHSYYVVPQDESLICTTTEYGYEFCSAIRRGNLFACQYHPEKSQDVGLQVLVNFRRLTER